MKVPRIREGSRDAGPGAGPDAGPDAPEDPVYDFARKRGWIAYGLHLAGGLGILGVHRFYLGFERSGKIQLALGILWIVSLFSIGGTVSLALQTAMMGWYVADLFLIPSLVRRRNAVVAQAIARRNGTAA